MTDHSDLIAELRALSAYPGDAYDRAASALSSQSLSLSEAREEIERLSPYREELQKIAADVGEPDDPFAAWEAIASLSPAATPVSEAEPGEGMAAMGEIARIVSEWRHGPMLSPEALRQIAALAKPASSPAGGDEIARWKRDSELLSAIQDECWDVRFTNSPNADAGDYTVNIEIVGHFMADPQERVVGENYNEDLRAALEQAMTAEAYPPARPIYDEPDEAALSQSTSAGRVGG